MSGSDPRRSLPSMDALLLDPSVSGWIAVHGRETVKGSLRTALERLRERGLEDESDVLRDVVRCAGEDLRVRSAPSLRPVLNGTGVVLHTNLGRAPLAPESVEAQRAAAGYGSVEFSLESGSRGSRYDHCADLVCELTGAEAALVTNNNAAAVSLAVNELALGREVVISRGELVEIGGSFRIPEVVERSGARLREIGTTNRTRASDYRAAIAADTGLILRVHPSNYRVEGFVERPGLEELVALAAETGVPLVHDVGSGLLDAALLPGFPPEPSVRESVGSGSDLVTWSGDKLLGGPQAGLLAGSAALIGRLRSNPLLRAFRVDKVTLAALEATLRLHRDPELAAARVPTLRMLREPVESVERRVRHALDEGRAGDRAAALGPATVRVVRTRAIVGGGAFPGFDLDSAGLLVSDADPDALAKRCRSGEPPLIGRIQDDGFIIDFRTIPTGSEKEAVGVLAAALRAPA